MRKYTFAIVMVLLSIQVWAVETSRRSDITIDGIKLLILTYENEEDGLIEKRIYGEGPVFSKVERFYTRPNKEFLSTVILYEVTFRDMDYRNENPKRIKYHYYIDNEIKIEYSIALLEDGVITTEHQYLKGRKDNLFKSTIVKLQHGNVILTREEYIDPLTDKETFTRYISYDELGRIITTGDLYAAPVNYIKSEIKKHEYPHFPAPNKPQTIITEFQGHPDGVLKAEQVNFIDNRLMHILTYDDTKTSGNFSRLVYFYTGRTLEKLVTYWERNPPFPGVYTRHEYLIERRTVYYDRFEKEVRIN